MPPKVRFSREAVIQAALEITRQHGLEAINARAVARALGCSTQPLFRTFQTMEQIKEEVRKAAMCRYEQAVLNAMTNTEKPYKSAGLAYLTFAREEPELFKTLFMCDRNGQEPKEEQPDASIPYVLEALMKNLDLSLEQAQKFHLHSWIYVHGMASMIATSFLRFTQEEQDQLLTDMYTAIRLLFERENGGETER